MIVAHWERGAERNDDHLKRSLVLSCCVSRYCSGVSSDTASGLLLYAFIFRTLLQASYEYDRETPWPVLATRSTMIHEEGRTARRRVSSRTNADDCLPRASLGRVEGGEGVLEGRDIADVRPQSPVPHSLDELAQLGTIGLDDEVDREAVDGTRLGRPDDGHQCSSGSNQTCGTF